MIDSWGQDIPNNVTKLSAAAKNSVVAILLSLLASTGTSTKLVFKESKNVDMIVDCLVQLGSNCVYVPVVKRSPGVEVWRKG